MRPGPLPSEISKDPDESSWPPEIPEGQEAVLWGVFVGEPAVDRMAVPLLDHAKEAEAAWLFKGSSAEKPKE